MNASWFGGMDLARLAPARSRSISAENPTGAKGAGAQASPGDDPHCSDAGRDLGRGWKIRPCLRNVEPGQTLTLAEIAGPGVIRHVWCTVLHAVHRWVRLRVYYDGSDRPSIDVPLGDFFANGLDGAALVNSLPVAVNPKGGMNCYWPMPFRKGVRIDVTNDGRERISEFFYQIDYTLEEVPEDAAYLHASWRRAMTTRERPEHVILETVRGRGHYVGTYLVWNQLSTGWWGEGEVKFFIDGDAPDGPTICGTGTEDYFGGAWGFVMDHAADLRPTTYSTAFLGYPQAVYEASPRVGPRPPAHALYRWHVPDPVRFERDLRVTVQALGWWPGGRYQPLTDDIASTAFWYQSPAGPVAPLAGLDERLAR
ncbi:MAG: DUF2961 domain-containing protein [Phycisphaerales bacterium]|nr:DUF2961 domain-containing protein [Phycisphaerales bacterium]